MKRILLLMICFSQFLIIVPKGLQASDYNASSKLNKIILPSSLSSIGEKAFYNCTGLNSFTIPETVTSIGSEAFGNCSNLQWIYSNPLVPIDLSNSPNVFSGVDKTNCKLNVPDGSLSLYKHANQWKDFFEVSESFDKASVKVTYENGDLVFRLYGDVAGLKVDMTDIRQLLGTPEFTNPEINPIINITDNTFIIEISTTVFQSDGMVFMAIPCSAGEISEIAVAITINGRDNQSIVDSTIGNTVKENNAVSIYPNPVQQTLFINGINENSRISIFNLSGKKVFYQNKSDSKIDVSTINSGIYILEIESASGKVVKKIVKQ